MKKIMVYLWFDVEDYITPEADEPPKRILEILFNHDVKATVKVVAEKIRALRERGREDVIEALSKMDVGYHLDTHSRHPTLYEYLADKNMESGASEFFRREKEGYDFVKRIFNRAPSCFGHPGSTWAPQVYPAMLDLGVPVYLDETPILNLDDSPYWYCNVLNLNGAGRNFINLDYFFCKPDGLGHIEKRFKEIHSRLQRRGGAVSILFHLHTIVNAKFWDEVNFGRGGNPPKEELKRPPRQPAGVTKRAYRDFEEFIEYMLSFKDIEFITATDANWIFHDDSRDIEITAAALVDLARKTLKGIRHQKVDAVYLSPAQIFYLENKAIAIYLEQGNLPSKLSARQPLGPLSRGHSSRGYVSTRSLLEASSKVLRMIETERYMPSEIEVDASILAPEDYMATISQVIVGIARGTKLSEKVKVRRGSLLEKKYISSQAFDKACRWVILPAPFKAPAILQQALLQAWTLKPAVASKRSAG